MTMRRNLRSTVLTAATVLVLAVTARAEREIEFVDGIIAKGYYKLAVEHLKKIAADADLPQKEKVLIPLKRGLAYRRMAAVEREPKLKEQYLTEASKALDEFAGRHPSHPQILNVSLEKVEIESDRARALQRRLADEKTPEDKAKLFKQIEQAYQKAIAAARTIVTEAGKKADVYRPRMHTPADKDKFWVYFGAEVRGMFQIGNVEYLWAQLYPEDPKDKTSAERRKHLEASAAQFKLTQKKRPRNNITMEAHVRRGICLRELAPFQKDAKERPKMLKEAMKEFQAALGVQRTPQTKPTRAEAYYQKAVTSYQIKEYEAAVSAVDGFTSENPDGVDSYRGQQALLLKARALGDLADEVRKRPRPAEGAVDWRDTYVQATRTVKDISPKYRQIREEADKLIQDWTKRFPAEDAVIVISPILAAARAKGAFEQGQLPQAIELYREVIALSEGKTQFVQFETEAWQNLGSCYYNQRRLYEADVAWSELLKRFPDVNGGEQIAYVIQAMYAYQHNQTNDDFDLGRFLESARVFVSRYPRDSRVFEVLTESANGYTIRGERIKAADIWGQARPENARYAESMFNSGDLYRQEFLKLVDAGRGGTPEAKQYVTKAEERLRLAADAKPPVAKTGEDYRGLALAGLAEMLADRKLPQPDSARKVPALVDEFKKRFAGETAVLPRVLLAGVGAHVVLKQPQEADKLATEIVEKHPLTEAFLPAVQLMILAWQDTSAEKANAWRTQQVDAAGDLSKARSITLLSLANGAWRQGNFEPAAKYFIELEKRFANPPAGKLAGLVEGLGESYRQTLAQKIRDDDPDAAIDAAALAKGAHRDIEESLGAVHFESGGYDKARPYYERFLTGARKALKADKTSTAKKNVMLLNLRRLAECHEVKGDPGTAVKLWQEFLDETYGPPAAPAHFEGVYHLARTYVRMNRYNEARKLIRKTEADFMGFGKDEELNKKLDELKKKINY